MADDPLSQRRPTIREVARLADVSHQTVSRYLRLDPTVNEAIGQRIGRAITQLDYRPNLVARAMRSRKTGRLGLLLPAGTAVSSLEVVTGATAAAEDAGYVVETVTLGGSPATRGARALELADSGLFEGIVSLTSLPIGQSRAGVQTTPIVVRPDYDEQMHGTGELADATRVADLVEELSQQGHRRFLHLEGHRLHPGSRRRRDAYSAAVRRLDLQSHAIIDCEWEPERARQAVQELPASGGPTAVIAANDSLAAGAISGALHRGWRVPDDLSVTGWDNSLIGAAMTPSLTTVDVDHESLGRRAIAELLAVLQQNPAPRDNSPLTTIIWRESTGPCPA